MLDVHIILSPHVPSAWKSKCLASVDAAIKHAGFPVDLHVAPFVKGHIGKSRAFGYAMGSFPYVTCVDDDDWIDRNAFRVLGDPMRAGHAAIYTRSTQWQNGRPTYANLRQHLRVFARDSLHGFDFDAWPALDSTALIAHADRMDDSINLPDRVYNYRIDPNSGARQILRDRPYLFKALRHAI